MQSKYELLIVYQDQALESNVLESIHRKGYKLSIYNNISEIEDSILSVENPIVLAYSSDEKSQSSFFEKLAGITSLKKYPIVAIAHNLTGLEAELNLNFPLAIAVRTPVESQKLIDSIRFVERNYRTKIGDSETETAESPEELELQNLLGSKFDKADIDSQIEQAKDFYTTIQELNLSKIDIGVESIAEILSENEKSKSFTCSLPGNKEYAEYCSDFLKTLKAQTYASIVRVSKLTNCIISALKLEPELADLSRTASILYSQSFAKQNRDLLQQDYAFKGGLLLRKQICSLIKDSALNLGSDLADRDLNTIIASIARLIGNEEQADNSQLAIIASAVCMADLINRKCYQNIFWNFRNAHRIAKAIRQGRFKQIHPSINCICLKFLSEALTSPKNMKLLGSVRLGNNTDLEKSIKVNDETLVDIPELQPGMKLARSLTTENGKAILDPEIILDHDLIMRIWQLSGICPLEKVVVRRTH